MKKEGERHRKHPGLCPECMSPSLELVRVKVGDGRILQWLECILCQCRQLRPQLQFEFDFTEESRFPDQFNFPFLHEEESSPAVRQDQPNPAPDKGA
jgi:hypothetical protein